ncbi:hypothetical protein [Ilumatobacter nonamiensis]|uniref:hypothetical protein n=1 Tax=Ilumatobacter nonamiensis TaxID=467093 RepID=UPI000344DB85|nr:hypothetical protein [Ilumatobacter nonamiensis]
MSRTIVIVAFVAALVIGCAGQSDQEGVDRWFDISRERLDADDPSTDVMQINPSAPCELVDRIEIDGVELELFGSGTARFGEIGGRYQCAWSGDATGAANVRLEVVTVNDADDFADYVDLVPTRDGNTIVDTDIGQIQVASFEPDPEFPPVTTAVLVVDEQQGGVHLVVEPLGPERDLTAKDYADLLVRLTTE